MLDNSVSRVGTLLFKGGQIYIDGWELTDGGMCREHVIFACLYVAQELMKAASATIAAPGGGKNTCADMPADTPRDWLCPETQAFYAMFGGDGDSSEVTGDQLATDFDRGYAEGYSDGCSDSPVDVRAVDCPACGKPMSEHKGDLKPDAVLWCP
jgi:hypothetical protein